MTDDAVSQMLLLAERLRESIGRELDDESIQAVAEATGAPLEYVRVAAHMLPEKKKRSTVSTFRSAFLTLEPETRASVLSALAATFCAAFHVVAAVNQSPGNSFFDTIALIFLGLGLWNVSLTRDSRGAVVSGALFGGVYFVAQGLFAFLVSTLGGVKLGSLPSPLLLLFLGIGAFGGFIIQKIVGKYRTRLGIQDPQQERQELLRQLVSLQDKLRSGEQSITFLSVDIVGSTHIKAQADPLSVEFTFNEYHLFVENAARRYQGRVHSTAGDGVILAFDHPQSAFAAARNMQTGIVELNTFRNKTGIPIALRCGIHTGSVVAPQAGDIKSINFAHVIDVAAHLQKECPVGGITVSDASAAHLPGGPSGVGVQRVRAADVAGTIWLPRHAVAALAEVSGPPALPEHA